jgi:hypothetical protein
MPKIDPLQAMVKLRTQAVGVGEVHTKHEARLFTKYLIQQGLVRALFLEGKSDDQEFFDENVQNPNQTQMEATLGRLGPDCQHKNSTLLVTVASYAIRSAIPVFLIDIQAGSVDFEAHKVDDSKIRETYGRITNFSTAGMTIRDSYAAGRFKTIVAHQLGGNRAGCVVLYGAEHFLGNQNHRPGASLAAQLNLDYVVFT